jgi:hypothetical protein
VKLTFAYRLFRAWDNSRMDSMCKALLFMAGESVRLTHGYEPRVSKATSLQEIYKLVPFKYSGKSI